jgi:hypothetical protein
MRTKYRRIVIIIPLLAVLAGCLAFVYCRHWRLYTVTVLPKFRHRVVTPCAINDHGQIVGFCEGRFLLWERDAGWRELGRASERLDINNAGQIAGTVEDPNHRMQSSLWDPKTGRTIEDPNYSSQAFLWDPSEGLTMLGTLGTGRSTAWALNNRGQVIGLCRDIPGAGRIFLWDKAQGMRMVKGVDGMPVAMNDAGQVIGRRGVRMQGREVIQDFLWEPTDDGSMMETSLPSGSVHSLNDKGYVLGQAFNFDERRHCAFLWRQGRATEWLFPLESQMARVVALNDANTVAVCEEVHSGWLERLTGRRFGPYKESFVWTRERGRVFLDGYVLTRRGEHFDIHGLNNGGSIIGMVGLEGRSEGRRAVLLEPIPKRWGR